MITVPEIRQKLERLKGNREKVESDLIRTRGDLTHWETEGVKIEKARIVIQGVAQQTQQALEYQLGELVTLALNAVFGGGWRFRVKFELRRRGTEADLVFEDEEGHVINPMTADGGGAVDVASKMLEISCWSLLKPKSRPVMLWDEPFKHLSTDLQPRIGEVIREMKEKLGLQFIIVTHEDELLECADKIFRVKKVKGESKLVGG